MNYEALYDRYHDSVRDALIRRACARRTITYGELAQRVGLPLQPYILSRQLPGLLDDISMAEHDEGWPLLSVQVLRKADGLPGVGFFKLVRTIGRLPPNVSKVGERAYFRKELQRVHSAWAD